MTLLINEIFYSIQGESSWSGLPFVFVRLTGCNLRCRYCDTTYAYDEGVAWNIDAIVAHLQQFSCLRTTITGGEPLMQDETPALVRRLIEMGYTVTVETNGSLDVGKLDRRCIKIMDLKSPSSGMQDHNRWENIPFLGPLDEVKIVIGDRRDFEFALAAAERIKNHLPPGRILFSPACGTLPATQLAQWMLASQVEARLQIQLHRWLWPGTERGV